MTTHHNVGAAPERTPHAIEGVWVPVRLEFSGEAAPELVIARTEVIFREGHYTVLFGGEVSFKGKYTLAPISNEPPEPPTYAHAKLHIEGRLASEKRDIVIPGIYQLVGDRLRICLGMDGTHPDAYATKAGSQHYLGTYRRQI